MLKVVKLGRSTYYYNLGIEEKEKAKPKGGKPRGYSLDKEDNKICDEQIKEFIMESIDGDAADYGYRKIQSYAEAYEAVNEFMEFYNNRRIHSSLRFMTPNEFYNLYFGESLTKIEIRV